MHSHSVLMFIAIMVSFTAGFLICHYNIVELKQIYHNVKQRVYKS